MTMRARLLDSGDTAVTVEFGDGVDPVLLARVAAFDRAVVAAVADGRLPGIVETVPTFRSVTLLYDPLLTRRADIDPVLHALLASADEAVQTRSRLWRFPVCYGGEFGPDLAGLADAVGLSPDEVVALHAGTVVRVHMLGFLPGFAFMGDLPEVLAQPRRSEPRVRVPAGSVATAGRLTAIYPWESPGGWHLLGRCPVPLFSPEWPGAALLRPGDRVAFSAIPPEEFAAMDAHWRSDRRMPLDCLVEDA